MPAFAPGFDDSVNKSILPLNTINLGGRFAKNQLNATTIGAAAGASTVVNRTQVKGKSSVAADLFNAAQVEVVQPINRVSTAADVTQMKKQYTNKKASFVFPKDLSGNGGPTFTRS